MVFKFSNILSEIIPAKTTLKFILGYKFLSFKNDLIIDSYEWFSVNRPVKTIWECCIKSPEQGAAEGAPFIEKHIIDVTEKAFDDFASAGTDKDTNKKILGIDNWWIN